MDFPDNSTLLLRVLIRAAHTPAQSLYSIDTITNHVAVQHDFYFVYVSSLGITPWP